MTMTHRPDPTVPAAFAPDELRASVRGRVIMPDEADYDDVRRVASGAYDRRPAVCVRVAGAADVARVVRLARETRLPLAVRSGGHSGAGHSTTDGGIVLDVRDLRALEVDVDGRTAWAEAGLTAGEVSSALASHGLAIGFGDTGSVGIGGITLGGGIGYLVRKHGLTIDSLLAADVVTADGRLLRADPETNPDLFWAIRGGGGNFGVVTRFRFRLHELDGIVGGFLVLPATADVVAGFLAAAAAAPEELSAIANIMPAPPLPFLPTEVHGQLVVFAGLVYAGDADAGQRALAPFRALATPLADLTRPMSYPEMFPPEDPSYRPTAVAETLFVDALDRAAVETIVDRLRASDAAMRVVQARVLGGAMARVPAEATAFAHRSAPILVSVAAFYTGPEDRAVRQAWVTDLAAALRDGEDRAYANFLTDEGEARVRAAYPGATWDRLAAVKRRYDPDNLFHLNQNIPPAPVARSDEP